MFQASKRLEVLLDTASGGRFQGAVTDAEVEDSTARIVAEFPLNGGPALMIGEGVSLTFPGLRAEEPFHAPAQVVTRIEDRRRMRYRFEVGRTVGQVLSPLADWRFATRVQPFPKAPVMATIERIDQATRYNVEVVDISATGIALSVVRDYESHFYSTWKLRVGIQLPGREEFEMLGNVCYRRPADDNKVLYGVDFDSATTLDFNTKQGMIHEYVTGCQAAAISLLRKALASRPAA